MAYSVLYTSITSCISYGLGVYIGLKSNSLLDPLIMYPISTSLAVLINNNIDVTDSFIISGINTVAFISGKYSVVLYNKYLSDKQVDSEENEAR